MRAGRELSHRRGVGDQIGEKARRKLKARREREHGIWFSLGMFGLVGWSVALPALLGIALGVWLDDRRQDSVSWTLTLLICGVALGCLNAWLWVRRESDPDR